MGPRGLCCFDHVFKQSVVRLSLTEEAFFQVRKDLVRKRLNKYTKKAFHLLPELDKPRILDIGCGSGVPTMELARLSNGEIIGLASKQIKRGEWVHVHNVVCARLHVEGPERGIL